MRNKDVKKVQKKMQKKDVEKRRKKDDKDLNSRDSLHLSSIEFLHLWNNWMPMIDKILSAGLNTCQLPLVGELLCPSPLAIPL